MAELASLPNLGFAVPQVTTAFNPTWTAPTYKPEDFEAALQFAPKPIAPDTFTAGINQLGGTLDNLLDPAQQLKRQNARDLLRDYNTPAPMLVPMGSFQGGSLAGSPAANLSDGSTPNLVGYSAPSSLDTGSGAPAPAVSHQEVGAVSNAAAPDEHGFHLTLGTTFATPNDLADYAKHGSLATGDNGRGKWNDDTTGSSPYVALPPDTLRAYGIDPEKARGTAVEVRANGKSVFATVADAMPNHAKNGAGIDLNPGTASLLGIDDVNNFKGPVQFRLVQQGESTPMQSTNPSATPMLTPSLMSRDDMSPVGLDMPASVPAPVFNLTTTTAHSTPLFGFQPNVDPAGDGRQTTAFSSNLPNLNFSRPSGGSAASAPNLVAPLQPGGPATSQSLPLLTPSPSTSVQRMPPSGAPPLIALVGRTPARQPMDPILAMPGDAQGSRAGLSGPQLMPQGSQPLSPAEMNFVRTPARPETAVQKMEHSFGPGHFVQDARGGVSYVGSPPRTATQQQLDQAELAERNARTNRLNQLANPTADATEVKDGAGNVIGHEVNGRFVRLPAVGSAATLDQRSDLQVQRDLVRAGADPAQYMSADGKTFDRLGAMSETARRNAETPDTGAKPMTEYQRKKEERLAAPKVTHDTYPHLSEDLKAQTGHTLADLLNSPPDNIHKEPGGLAYYLNDSTGMPSKRVFLSDEQHQEFVDRYNAIKGGSPRQINAPSQSASAASAASNAAPHVDSMGVGAIINQNGQRYQKQADGSWKEL